MIKKVFIAGLGSSPGANEDPLFDMDLNMTGHFIHGSKYAPASNP